MPRVTRPGNGVKNVPKDRLDAYLKSGWTEVGEEVPLTTDAETAIPQATAEDVAAAQAANPMSVEGIPEEDSTEGD